MKYFLSIVTMLAMLSYASALSCFVCTSVEDGTCNGEQLVECNALSAASGMAMLLGLKPSIQVIPSTKYQCYKLVAEHEVNDHKVAIKACIYDTVKVCDGAPVNAEQKECYTCMEDECNGSNQIRTSFGIMISLIVVTLMIGSKH